MFYLAGRCLVSPPYRRRGVRGGQPTRKLWNKPNLLQPLLRKGKIEWLCSGLFTELQLGDDSLALHAEGESGIEVASGEGIDDLQAERTGVMGVEVVRQGLPIVGDGNLHFPGLLVEKHFDEAFVVAFAEAVLDGVLDDFIDDQREAGRLGGRQ